MAVLKPSRLGLFPAIVLREKLTRGERARKVGGEPEVMDEEQGVVEYDEFGAAGEIPVHHFSARAISRLVPKGGTLLDLGCGSGRLLARFAHGRPDAKIVGLDLSEPMLETGRRNLEREGVAERVELRRGDMTDFEAQMPDDVDAISCNFALHHVPDEATAVRCLEAIGRGRASTGCAVWIFDFARLRNPATWPAVAAMIDWPGPVVHNDAIASEEAAFTFDEMKSMLDRAGLGDLEHVRSRPLGENQAHWAAGRSAPYPVTALWQDRPLPREVRLMARLVQQGFPRSMNQT